MNGRKKYWIFFSKWALIYLKDRNFGFYFKRLDDYWILFIGKFLISNDIIKLNKDWNNL